jgi:hypothetical protein
MIQAIYRVLLIPELVKFLSRLTFSEEGPVQLLADAAFPGVFQTVDPELPDAGHATSFQEGVEVALFGSFLNDPQLWSIVPAWPASEPAWLMALAANSEERRFLAACQNLTAERRCLLFLSFYGQLPIRTITQIIQETIDPHRTAFDVLRDLHAAWQQVLSAL